MDRIELCLQKYRKWCRNIGISTVSDLNRIIEDGEVNYLVNVSEIWHEQNISEIANYIRNNIDTKKLILISGPSSSGKTSFANRLKLHLKVSGVNAVSISLDNYYLPREQIPPGSDGKPDYEVPEALDLERFNRNISDLIEGREVIMPIYSFGYRPNSEYSLSLFENDVIIVEGLHALNPVIAGDLPLYNKYKIYCSALTALTNDDGSKIRSRTNRLIRRLIRDYSFRNSSPEFTFDIWQNVEQSAAKYIFPFTDEADVVFNSSLLYEFSVYKKHILKLLTNYDGQTGMEHKDEILNLMDKVIGIDDAYVPGSSLAREFIGGSSVI